MAFKIKDGVRIGTTDVFNNQGVLLVDAPRVASRDGLTYVSAESTYNPPGSATSDDTLRFATDGTVRLSLSTELLDLHSSVTSFTINATTASTDYTNGALVVKGGVGVDGDLNVSGAVTFSELGVDNINLNGNTISTTNTDGDLNLEPNGTGNVNVNSDTLRVGDQNANATITTNGTGDLTLSTNGGSNSGVITIADGADGTITLDPHGSGYVEIVGTNGLVIPSGTTLQQGPAVTGAIRYNTTNSQFEGYSGTNWSSLGGVRSVDGATYITAETTPGASDDTLSFVTDSVERMSLDTDSLDIDSSIETVNINATTASTSTTSGALVVDGGVGVAGNLYIGGTLSAASASFSSINNTPIGNATPSTGAFTVVDVDNLRLDGSTLSSTDANGNIILDPNGTGKVEINPDAANGGYTLPADRGTDGYVLTINNTSGASTWEAPKSISLSGDSGSGSVAPLSETLTFEGGTGIVASVSGSTVTFTPDLATTTDVGVASFATADFNVTSGAVELNDAVIKGLTVDANAAVTPSGHSVQITGGEGIDVTAAGAVITVTGEDASDTNKGIASFSSSYFTVSGGDVAINDATISTKGIASFATGDFDVTDGEVTIKTGGVDNDQLANSTTTIGTTTVTLGSTTTTLDGLTDVTVGNLNFTGNTILATDSGNISLDPDGGNVDVNGAKITGLGTPTDPTDAATKGYVDAARSGLDLKESVRAATTENITLNQTTTAIDGVTLADGDRVLVKDQTTGSQNGIYVVSTSGAWTRAEDADGNPQGEVNPGMFTFVEEGDVNGDSGFVLVNNGTVTIGTTALDFTLFSTSGTLVAGEGLSKDGYTLKVNVATNGGIEINADDLQLKSTVAGDGLTYTNGVIDVVGTTNRISVTADAIDISENYVGQSSITTVGTITTGTWEGDVLAGEYGGTGVANTGKTITLGGNLTTSGAHSTTITTTANTTVTLPTTGTLYGTKADSITSAELAGSLTDETGYSTGAKAVFSISPEIATSITTGNTTFDLINTTATTVNFAGAATTLNVGSAAGTVSFSGNVSIDGTTVHSGDVKIDNAALEFTTEDEGDAKVSVKALAPSTINGATGVAIDSWAGATYRSGKYTIQVVQTNGKYQTSEVLIVHDGTTTYQTEYSVVESSPGAPIPITFTSAYSGGTITVTATVTDGATNNATILMHRTLFAV